MNPAELTELANTMREMLHAMQEMHAQADDWRSFADLGRAMVDCAVTNNGMFHAWTDALGYLRYDCLLPLSEMPDLSALERHRGG